MSLGKSVLRNLPVSFIILIFFTIYTIYLEFVCLPTFEIEVGLGNYSIKYTKDAITHLLYFHVLGLLLLWSFIMTCITEPGFITDEWKLDPNNIYDCIERKQNGELRYCRNENCYKPDRAHYCRPLGRNVLKMDHYCPWVSNGIGFYNYKYFFLTLFYSDLISIFMFKNITKAFYRSYYDPNSKFYQLFYLSLISILILIISLIIIPFTLFHLFLIITNKTTIECFSWNSTPKHSYNLGLFHNIQAVLGTNILLWLLPVGKPPGDGIHFQTNLTPP
ncbi:DHHC palmitoyltransferase family protein [Theileria parva strain Muguga]|uniref:DHHC palmitoyltransferase family protein n=1 Tax=Theileria parva strain Muguga TaxID=333668 RepID=UPI001C622E21|nr:DHHC palmitoyltransferase family protein [Theileria parva strain Muguga]EAN33805.2 DHHC palmitoyltransferase family protein [Theileria parva strain Muguga]